MSPIAVTRMVTAALDARRRRGRKAQRRAVVRLDAAARGDRAASVRTSSATTSRGAAARSCSPAVPRWRGVEPPRLLEVVRTDDVVSSRTCSRPSAQDVGAGRGEPAERRRQQPAARHFLRAADRGSSADGRHDMRGGVRPSRKSAAALTAALEARGVKCIATARRSTGSERRRRCRRARRSSAAVVGRPAWEAILAEHDGIVDGISRRRALGARRVRLRRGQRSAVALVTLTDAVTAGGRSRAQAAAQLARTGAQDDEGSRRRVRRQRRRHADTDERPNSPPICCAARMRSRCPAPNSSPATAGSACAATRVRRPAFRSAARRSPTGSTTRSERRSDDAARAQSSTPTCTCGTRRAPIGIRTCRAASS